MTDDCHLRASETVLSRREGTANFCLYPEEQEIIGRDMDRIELLGGAALGGGLPGGTPKIIGGQVLECSRELAPEHEPRKRGHVHVSVGRFDHELDKAIRLRIWQWLEQHPIDNREYGRVCANAEGKHGNRGRRERRAVAQRARRITEITHNVEHCLTLWQMWFQCTSAFDLSKLLLGGDGLLVRFWYARCESGQPRAFLHDRLKTELTFGYALSSTLSIVRIDKAAALLCTPICT